MFKHIFQVLTFINLGIALFCQYTHQPESAILAMTWAIFAMVNVIYHKDD